MGQVAAAAAAAVLIVAVALSSLRGRHRLGFYLTIAAVVACLSWLNRLHVEVRAARGRDVSGATALEQVLVASGVLALVIFTVWFFGFSGSAPIPLRITY